MYLCVFVFATTMLFKPQKGETKGYTYRPRKRITDQLLQKVWKHYKNGGDVDGLTWKAALDLIPDTAISTKESNTIVYTADGNRDDPDRMRIDDFQDALAKVKRHCHGRPR